MSSPTPVQSFLGGVGLSLPVYSLLILNGNVFGISGFFHRAIRGNKEALFSVLGLVAGGICVGLLENAGPQFIPLDTSRVLLSGLLAGLGTKLANGCTSGHMICGISRFSLRSLAATTTFFGTGVITTHILHSDLPVPSPGLDWSLGPRGPTLLGLQAIPLSISFLLSQFITPKKTKQDEHQPQPHTVLRVLNGFLTSVQFALALRLSNLTEPSRVLSFLLLPVHRAFDPSLAFLAIGALPISIFFYHYFRGDDVPRLGGLWSVPKPGPIDARLIAGAALFGVGWGIAGVCPGPALVNFGRALSSMQGLQPLAQWLGAFAIGGWLV